MHHFDLILFVRPSARACVYMHMCACACICARVRAHVRARVCAYVLVPFLSARIHAESDPINFLVILRKHT
jgi:hypothetical protein